MVKSLLRFGFIIIFLSLSSSLWSQPQASKWYFGRNAGLDFSTNPPTILTGSAMRTYEGCASIADASGNLLFYTNGDTVYTKTHQIMSNGTNLNGHWSSTQSALIVKKPGSATLYYIFTTGNCGFGGFYYSIVDMSLQSGLGAVTIKNTLLYTPTSEKLAAVRHCNGNDVWIVSHSSSYTNTFRVYLLTSTGVSNSSVNSSLGLQQSPNCPAGCIKISPNGRKLVLAQYTSSFELFDFDNSTGIVSNNQTISTGTDDSYYGCEFSPDGTKVYAGQTTFLSSAEVIVQWDLCGSSPIPLAAFQHTFTSSAFGTYPGTMQLAPNGRIYIARPEKPFLSAILKPNLSGQACNIVDTAQLLAPNSSISGLPNFMAGMVKEPLLLNLSCGSASFVAPSKTNPVAINCTAPGTSVTGFNWLFGDPASVAANMSTLANPVHYYNAGGTYTVKLVVTYSNCAPDTIINTITVAPAVTPTLSVNGSFSICNGQVATFTVTGANTYSWSTGATAKVYTVSPAITTTYNVVGTNTLNLCTGTSSITVKVFLCTALTETEGKDDLLNVYPNPNTGILSVDAQSKLRYILFDHLGKIVSERNMHAGINTIDMKNQSNGIYTLKLFGESSVKTFRIIKNNSE